VRQFGSEGSGPGQFSNPTSIRVLHDICYITSYGNNNIQLFTTTGRYLRSFSCATEPIMHITRYPTINDTSTQTGDTVDIPTIPKHSLIVASTSNCIEVYT
jgi:hypothetical protein